MKYINRTNIDLKKVGDNFLRELLLARGVIKNEPGYLEKFFNPTKEKNELDPSLFDNIEDGYRLLMSHLKNHSKFYLVVDPDADGYTSSALFYNYIKQVFSTYEPNIIYHIPEGKAHGLDTIMDWFPDIGDNSLIVLPDSSSNDYEYHKELRTRGYDLLVLDHHLTSEYSQDAVVINNQLSEKYENKNLSGVGVVYKFFEYVEKREKMESYSTQYLDLVALGQTGDMMNMNTLENRYILTEGLKNINNRFFQTLLDKQDFSLKGERTQIGIAFYIVPLINSIIRLGLPEDKEKLFLAFVQPDLIYPSTKRGHKEGDTENICEQMARICVNTKNRQNKERDKALEILDIQIIEQCLSDNQIIILNADELDIPKTMTGLCAMGVVSKYKKPVLLGRIDENGYFKGSARGNNDSELKDFKGFLEESGFMEEVAGHAQAFGQAIKVSNIDKLIKYANEKLANINFGEGFWEVDFVVNGNYQYLPRLINQLVDGKEFYGQGCPEPMIAVNDIIIDTKDILYRGQESNTVAFKFNNIEYIKFKDSELADSLRMQTGKIKLSIVGVPQINEWCGKITQ